MSKKLKFIREKRPEAVAQYIAERVQKHLDEGQSVVWFLSGGSSIEVASLAMNLLRPNPNLVVTLADERYGSPGHPDSNWEQLVDTGFDLKNARLEPVLRGGNPDQTLADFEQLTNDLLNSDSYRIALLGIGTDGHTAGILPGSPAVSSKRLVSFYEASDYRRITLTPKALSKLDEAVVYAIGESKLQALQNLGKDLSVEKQPAQILKKIPHVTIYNDSLGDNQT